MDILPRPVQRSIDATSVGYVASNVLKEESSAKVVGVTSRGIFLRSSSRWMVFISGEPYRSPLTITVRGVSGSLEGVYMGDVVNIHGGEMVIAGADLVIQYGSSALWQPRFPPNPASPKAERQNRLDLFSKEVMERKMGSGLSPVLSILIDWWGHREPSFEDSEPLHASIINIQSILPSREVNSLLEDLYKLLGAGQGLTPSGDDFIVGFLLSLNRWKGTLWPKDGLSDLNERLVTAAYDRTTTLSANLIDFAAQGQADERLINAVDYLMCGVNDIEGVVGDLLSWGSSSGADAFVGICTAITVR
jgi:hypothetical protein